MQWGRYFKASCAGEESEREKLSIVVFANAAGAANYVSSFKVAENCA